MYHSESTCHGHLNLMDSFFTINYQHCVILSHTHRDPQDRMDWEGGGRSEDSSLSNSLNFFILFEFLLLKNVTLVQYSRTNITLSLTCAHRIIVTIQKPSCSLCFTTQIFIFFSAKGYSACAYLYPI